MRDALLKLFVTLAALNGLILSPVVAYFYAATISQEALWPFFASWIGLCLAVLAYLHLLPVHRRRKRKKLGLCIKCGYDLRGSKDRCPECGEEFVSTNVAR